MEVCCSSSFLASMCLEWGCMFMGSLIMPPTRQDGMLGTDDYWVCWILVWKTRDALRLVHSGNDQDERLWEASKEECDERVGYCWLVAWLVVFLVLNRLRRVCFVYLVLGEAAWIFSPDDDRSCWDSNLIRVVCFCFWGWCWYCCWYWRWCGLDSIISVKFCRYGFGIVGYVIQCNMIILANNDSEIYLVSHTFAHPGSH